MTDYIEWDGTEERLYELLIWWSTREPFVHTENCEGKMLHCCEGVYPPQAWVYGLQGSTAGPARKNPTPIPLEFVVSKVSRVVRIGDRIHYDGNYVYRLERR